MKTPTHWQTKNILARLLYVPSCGYAAATWLRLKLAKPQHVSIPVICIGNLTAGGSGKTPVAISIAHLLKQKGKNPFFVSRGYGGKLQDVVVNPKEHRPDQVGDEPLLLAQTAPVVVNRQRYLAATKAINNGADIIIMDDGFQNPTLYKDISLLVIDGQFGLGNTYPIPAGPMREFLSEGRKRANGIILLGPDKNNVLSHFKGLPVFKGELTPMAPHLKHRNAIAFAGIGRPEKFYQSLKACHINLIKTVDFPDHHFYQRGELENIITEAKTLDADIFTTAKDMVKIPEDLKQYFQVLEITIKWQDQQSLQNFLLKSV